MNSKNRQRAQTLIVGLVMLVVLTLLVMSALRASNINTRIAGNMQMQEETATAAKNATEQVISANFTANPVSQVIAVDINNDGTSDYTADVPGPRCTGSLAVTNAQLNPANAADVPCISSAAAQQTGLMVSGVIAAATGPSWCYLQQWEVQAQVTDSRTGATATSTQGVSLRVPVGTECP